MMRTRRRRGLACALVAALAVAGTGCAAMRGKRETPAELLPAEQAYRQGLELLSQRKLVKAKTTLEAVQFGVEDRPRLEPLVQLALADVVFYSEDTLSLIDARAKYIDFVTLYGDHPRAPYAQFQAGVCSMKQVLDPSRDQSQTRAAIGDFEEVRRRFPTSPYAQAAADMVRSVESNLAEHEYVVGTYYLKRKAYLAASDRFRNLLETYPRFRERNKVYYQLGRALVLSNSVEEGRLYLDKLVADDPTGRYAEDARRFLAETEGSAGAAKR